MGIQVGYYRVEARISSILLVYHALEWFSEVLSALIRSALKFWIDLDVGLFLTFTKKNFRSIWLFLVKKMGLKKISKISSNFFWSSIFFGHRFFWSSIFFCQSRKFFFRSIFFEIDQKIFFEKVEKKIQTTISNLNFSADRMGTL